MNEELPLFDLHIVGFGGSKGRNENSGNRKKITGTFQLVVVEDVLR
jgi:hypothetical protein